MNIADNNRNAVGIHPRVMASSENSSPIIGKATLMEEPMNGMIKDINMQTIRAITLTCLSSFPANINNNYTHK
jgi:hypothetical protein